MACVIIDMVHDHTLLRDSRVHKKSHYPPMYTRDEVPEAHVALVAKVNALIDTTGVKGETLFPCYLSRTAGDSIDRSNQVPILNLFDGKDDI